MSTSYLPDAGQPESATTGPARGPVFLFFFAVAAAGAAMANLVPAVLTLSVKATVITPDRAPTIVSAVVSVGALCALIAFPVFGRLSDRTTSRLGRRRPYLLLAAVLFAIGAVGTYLAGALPALIAAGVATSVGFAAATVALTAVVADQFGPGRRGLVSAILGLSLPVGAVIGLFLAQLVAPRLGAMILLPAAIGVLGNLVFAVVLTDRRLTRDERPAFGRREFLSTFWVNPVKTPDFAWAWWSRFLIFVGVAAVQAYQPFYLIEVLHYPFEKIAGGVFLSTLVLTAAALVFAPLAGRLSDRIGRRKPFVIAAALIFGVGLLLASQAASFGFFLFAVAIVGIGQGVYLAVDIALVTQILPDVSSTGKDLGVMNLANNLPASIVPAVAPVVLALGASAAHPRNFSLLFILGAVAGLIGAALIAPIRSTR